MKRQIYLFRDVLPEEGETEVLEPIPKLVVEPEVFPPEENQLEKTKIKVRTKKTFPKKDKEEEIVEVVEKKTGGIRVLPELPTDTKMSKDTVLDDDGNKVKYEYPMLEIF